jgi:hypothetical protein
MMRTSVDAARSERHMSRLVTVSEFPVVQHRHPDGAIVSVRLRRVGSDYRTVCVGCNTEFLYRKPARSRIVHHKSPILPEVKGNYDDPSGH